MIPALLTPRCFVMPCCGVILFWLWAVRCDFQLSPLQARNRPHLCSSLLPPWYALPSHCRHVGPPYTHTHTHTPRHPAAARFSPSPVSGPHDRHALVPAHEPPFPSPSLFSIRRPPSAPHCRRIVWFGCGLLRRIWPNPRRTSSVSTRWPASSSWSTQCWGQRKAFYRSNGSTICGTRRSAKLRE